MQPKDYKIVLSETVNSTASETFNKKSYEVCVGVEVTNQKAHCVGIRSTIHLSKEDLQNESNLLAIACYTVGFNNVDIDHARTLGIPVFNTPFASTRSVAEFTHMASYILIRKAADLNQSMKEGTWNKKLAKRSEELLGKTIGIIGYGNIGSQVGIMSESDGMQVIYYDHKPKQSYRNNTPVSLKQLLQTADIVTLHVPETETTKGMIGKEEIAMMKKGSILINASRGSVVDLRAVEEALESKHLAGVALDVFPKEPADPPLKKFENVFLTPHVGGSTQQAQERIGIECSETIIRFFESGSTEHAVNFPNLKPLPQGNAHRILYIHKNKPGADANISSILSKKGLNIQSKMLGTQEDIGYLIIDVECSEISNELVEEIKGLPNCVSVRILKP